MKDKAKEPGCADFDPETARLHPPFIPAWLRKILRDLKGAPISVLVAYGSFANRGGCAFPSIQTLCQVTGYGLESVKTARRVLLEKGLLSEVGQERSGGRFGRKIFRLGWKETKAANLPQAN